MAGRVLGTEKDVDTLARRMAEVLDDPTLRHENGRAGTRFRHGSFDIRRQTELP